MVVFPSFQALDVFGPLDVLNLVSWYHPIKLSIIASTLEPVSTKPWNSSYIAPGADFYQEILPTHTFKHPPKDLDVLMVPGGLGTGVQPPLLLDAIEYIKDTYPRLQYIISICAGATMLARAGVIDGRRATGNKAGMANAMITYPKVNWVPVARWVTDGNIWTTSGVAAGLDGTWAFVGKSALPCQAWQVLITGRLQTCFMAITSRPTFPKYRSISVTRTRRGTRSQRSGMCLARRETSALFGEQNDML
jgi:transcriptional regulator GlxA family with amidase domain